MRVFLDRWEIVSGQQPQASLIDGIGNSKCCVVFLGPHGRGPWQHQEIQVAIDRRTHDQEYRVVPVLLPGFDLPPPGKITRLAFLFTARWVRFFGTLADEQAFGDLVYRVGSNPLDRTFTRPMVAAARDATSVMR